MFLMLSGRGGLHQRMISGAYINIIFASTPAGD